MTLDLSQKAITVLEDRYLKKDKSGNVIETSEEMFRRVAWTVASAETSLLAQEVYADRFYKMMSSLEFMPNSPTLRNAGRTGCLSACFVAPIEDSMFGICRTREQMAFIIKHGGGVGVDYSPLRPRGDLIASTHRGACGPVAVMRDFNMLSTTFTQGAGAFREGAQMANLRVDHPDIEEFIHCKDDGGLSHMNISVVITDEFIEALRGRPNTGHYFDLRWGDQVYKSVDARYLFHEIAESAWKTGDPGLFFVDRVNGDSNPLNHITKISATNPCLAGSALMLTDSGLRRIDDLVSEESCRYWTPNGWEFGKAIETGKKQCVALRLSNGQYILCTPDHKILTCAGWMAANDTAGQKIIPFIGNADWIGDDHWPDDVLVKLGFFQGDGKYHQAGGGYIFIGKNDSDIVRYFSEYKVCGSGAHKRYIPLHDPFITLAREFGILETNLPNRSLPDTVFTLSPKSLRLFLRGLYSANGSVLKKTRRVTFKSTCRKLVEQMQILLLSLGYRPYITVNRAKATKWMNGVFISRESYDLNLAANEDVLKFRDEIGFVQHYKTEILRGFTKVTVGTRRALPTVVKVSPVGEMPVFDFTVGSSHAGCANGLTVHNCGEQSLDPYSSCNLASINLSKFIKNNTMDWDRLGLCVLDGVRFLDDVVEVNSLPTPETERANKMSRRIGLGVMGWADVLIALKIPYASEKALKFAELVMSFIRTRADAASLALGEKRGPYGAYSGSLHGKQGLPFRNSFRLSIQPTGSVSLLAGCSCGIEPIYAESWVRTIENGTKFEEYHPEFVKYKDSDSLPEYLQTAMVIPPEWHVRMQAAFQKYVDNGISKTINMPSSASVDDVKKSYWAAINSGCKGVTVFRDGCKDKQVLQSSPGCAKIQLCKDCGTALVVSEGCMHCPNCGYSACVM